MFLITGLSGSFLVTLSAQFITTNIADLQGVLGASADEASWIATVYTMASFAGIIASGPLIRTFGLGRCMAANAALFGVAGVACAAAPSLALLVGLRTIQGFAAGGFGPIAFVTVFTVTGGPRLPFGLMLLAFVLLFPTTLGPVISGFVEDGLGWQSLFAIQAGIGVALGMAALAWLPRQPVNWAGLETDWTAMALLATALATLVLVLNQGTRQFWFESDMISWCAAASLGAWAGFLFLCHFSPVPIIAPRLLLTRTFGIPVGLTLVFRAGFAVTTYLVPQFLGIVQGYRPLEVAELLLWTAIPQLLALPLVWWLLHRLDGRIVLGGGMLLCGVASALVLDATSLFAGDQFRLALLVFGIAQLMFLVPDVIIGAGSLKPADFPTASLAFNGATLGGTTLGVGLVSNFVTERQKFHSNVLTESFSLYDAMDADRLAAVANTFGSRLVDDAAATARAVAVLAATVRREAWVLSFNDAFLVVACVLAVSAAAVLAIGRCRPLPPPQSGVIGEKS